MFSERHHSFELRAVADFAPLRVISILLAPAGIPARRLQMAARLHRYPYVAVRRWNGKPSDSLQVFLGRDPAILGRDVAETAPYPQAPNAGLGVRNEAATVALRFSSSRAGLW